MWFSSINICFVICCTIKKGVSKQLGSVSNSTTDLVRKNMYTELSKAIYAYCQCRNHEREWSIPPKICARFHRLPRNAPPRVTISILTYLPLAMGRLQETVCHYAKMSGVYKRCI